MRNPDFAKGSFYDCFTNLAELYESFILFMRNFAF